MLQQRHRNTTRNLFAPLAAPLATLLAAMGLAALLTGCAGSLPANFGVTQPAVQVHVTGRVFGGQQPVVGAKLQLYAINTSTLAGAATALIGAAPLNATPPLSGAGGAFSITGLYTCNGSSDVYLVATGGNPGGGANSNLTLVAALGQCSSLSASTGVEMNELTTVAAAYALAPFATGYSNIGSPSPTGIDNAFQMANTLVNVASGAAGVGVATGVTVPVSELDTLGNIVAACVNTTGAASPQCTQLFAATGATETFGAALAMARAPGAAATTGLYTLSSSTAPFQPSMSLSSAPNDFSVAVTYAGAAGTLSTPYGIAIDATGNAWVTNETGTTVAEFSPTGSVLATPTATGLVGAQGLGFDELGHLWVANTAGNSAVRFTLASGAVSATNVYTDPSFAAPTGVAFDNDGSAFFPNLNGNSVTVLSTSSGAANAASPITGSGFALPRGIAADSSGRIYVTSGNGSVLQLQAGTAAPIATLTDNALQGPANVGLMGSQVFVTGSTTGSAVAGAVGEYTTQGAVAGSPFAFANLTSPAGVAADSASAWIVNSTASGSLFQIGSAPSTAKSPAAGFGVLHLPIGVALDGSGSVWVTNSGNNTISVFVGLAQPVLTPYVLNES